MLGDPLHRMLVGGRTFPKNIEGVMSGAMQARYAHSQGKNGEDLLVHPDYTFNSIARNIHAIRGAFTLRLIGSGGMSIDELGEHETSTDQVPQLEFLGEIPVTYKLLGVRDCQ